MLRRIDLRGLDASPVGSGGGVRAALPRAEVDVSSVTGAVQPLLDAVRDRGADAIAEISERLDHVRPPTLRVAAAALSGALRELDPAVREALTESIRRVRIAQQAARPTEVRTEVVPGGVVTERWVPVGRVGLYVPGGLAVYPSSVVMNVVPAQVAGVASLAIASPPQPEFGGLPHPVILAAAALLGVDEVYAVGGAQAIAMFGYGVPDTDGTGGVVAVDLVTGPGNVYVAAAKRLLRGVVGTDSEAGPTEIAVLADAGADPGFVAADLISQAEHDTLAASVLVTDSVALIDAVQAELTNRVPRTKHADRVAAALSGRQSGAVLVRDLDQGLAVVNSYAAEHLEVLTADAAAVAGRISAAGAVFVGPYAPVSLGDYCAGSNHVLPTGGTARYVSGLSAYTFCKQIHQVSYDESALAQVAGRVVALAEAEDLPAHGEAVIARSPDGVGS